MDNTSRSDEDLPIEDINLLTEHLGEYMRGGDPISSRLTPELGELITDFIIGLTFPSRIHIGDSYSRRWKAFFFMSNFWNNPKNRYDAEMYIKATYEQRMK